MFSSSLMDTHSAESLANKFNQRLYVIVVPLPWVRAIPEWFSGMATKTISGRHETGCVPQGKTTLGSHPSSRFLYGFFWRVSNEESALGLPPRQLGHRAVLCGNSAGHPRM